MRLHIETIPDDPPGTADAHHLGRPVWFMVMMPGGSTLPEASHSAAAGEEDAYYALNKRVYAWFARYYDLVALPLRGVRWTVAAMAELDRRSKVLDIGTGTGSQARAFAAKAGEVVGVDISESMLRIARLKNRSANLTFQRAGATELPFEGASFDVVCISFALHEMPLSIRERALSEMVRVTKPSGTMIVVDYGSPPGALGDVFRSLVKLYERDHYVDFSRSDLNALLHRTGIEPLIERHALWGAVRIVVGSRRMSCGAPAEFAS